MAFTASLPAALLAALCLATAARAAEPVVSPELEVAAPSPRQSWVAKIVIAGPARAEPSGTGPWRGYLSTLTPWGTPMELLVLGSHTDDHGRRWLQLMLDERPNGSYVWVPESDTTVHPDPWRITVMRSRRRLHVYYDGGLASSFEDVVGKPSTPTPDGRFAIMAKLRQPEAEDFEGSWVMPLSAHSLVLQHFEGGDGQIALHGRGGASLADPLGTARSHGCVRLANAAIGWIAARVPVGTPVEIS